MGKAHTYNYVYQYFKDSGCELLSKEYIASANKLDYVCNCGNKHSITFNNFRAGHRCKLCGAEKLRQHFTHSYNYIKEYFAGKECILISENYVGAFKKLDYICRCGTHHSMTFANFESNKSCPECKREQFRGKNNPRWNSSKTSEERQDDRKYPQYDIWRKGVYSRDNYFCQLCGSKKSGILIAHHINSYLRFPELRTELSNGVTLCNSCHKEFHSTYGNKNFSAEDFKEFMQDKIETKSDTISA